MPDSKITLEKQATKKPAIELLGKLGYKELEKKDANEQRGKLHNVLLKGILKRKLEEFNRYEFKGKNYHFSNASIESVIKEFDEPLTSGLIDASEKIYNHMLLGIGALEKLPDGRERTFNINFIDWDNFSNNEFHYVEEFTVESYDGRFKRTPDIVLFINGIPFCVIECKRPSVPVDRGIEQTIGNQQEGKIPQLYKFTQMLISTNKNSVKYGTTASDKEFWSIWKEKDIDWIRKQIINNVNGRFDTEQDKVLIGLLELRGEKDKEGNRTRDCRLYEFMRYFIVYEGSKKIIARYNQYFAVKETYERALTYKDGIRNGGTMFQTQGSGKSLEMIISARYMLEKLTSPHVNPRIIVVTDRVELDEQITKTFNSTGLAAKQANNGKELLKLINNKSIAVITTLVHKFKKTAVEEVTNGSSDIFVFVDEAHRTQYNRLYNFMRDTLPNACFIGFTGTPLIKDVKKNTIRQFGDMYKSKYTMYDGVEDKAIVKILYEGRNIDQEVINESINTHLDKIISPLNEKQQELVKQKWSKYSKLASANSRIQRIAFDINEHFINNYKGKGSKFKAMLATERKLEAVRYLHEFEKLGDLKVAVVISPPDTREGSEKVDESKDREVVEYWEKIINQYGNKPEVYESSIKNKFRNTDEIDLLIVVDKLLTGYDAPRAAVLYLDKKLKEHNLLQAIARVNRVYAGKEYGMIVDYRGLLKNLNDAMKMYSGAGLEEFDPEDLKGMIYDIRTMIADVRTTHANLASVFKSVMVDKKKEGDLTAYERVLEDEKTRNEFYDKLNKFASTLTTIFESYQLYKSVPKDELEKYREDLKFFQELRSNVRLIHFEKLDHKEFEPKMQTLMDNYIFAGDPYKITESIDIFDMGFESELDKVTSKKSKADMIKSRLEKRISIHFDENPVYYKKFKERLEETLENYKQNRLDEAELYSEMYNIMNDFKRGESEENYPEVIRGNKHAKAFYSSIKSILEANYNISDKEELIAELSIKVKKGIEKHLKVDWYDNMSVHKNMEQELDDLLFDFADDNGLNIQVDDIDKIIEALINIARHRM